jgi:outer membrane protein TolC
LDRQQWGEAEQLARESLQLTKKIGRKGQIATDSRRLAQALIHQGRGLEARSHAERAVAIYEELRSPYLLEAKSLLNDC